jgi:hypothetical protein
MNRLALDDAAVIEASRAEPVRDVSGRPGIGVVWHFYGSKAMNIFDPRTFAYLGMTTWGEQGH